MRQPIALTVTAQAPAPRGLLRFKRLLRRALALQKIRRGSWSITLVDDTTMAELHARTMNLPTTTDVLTFDLRDADVLPRSPETKSKVRIENLLDLDSVLCVDEARRRAAELGDPLMHELLLYAVHSLLHVCGYDDRTAAQARRMHRREDTILIGLGVGPVYAGSRPGSAVGPARRRTARPVRPRGKKRKR